MQNLQIDKNKAKKLFKNAAPEFKEMLIDTFGDKFFSEKITDRVKTWEDVCEIKNQDPFYCLPYPSPTNKNEEWLNACKKLSDIREVLNEGWVPDWANVNQRKWFPYFEYKSGFGFSHSDCGSWGTLTGVGSRLCYKDSETAEYAAKQFINEYNKFLN